VDAEALPLGAGAVVGALGVDTGAGTVACGVEVDPDGFDAAGVEAAGEELSAAGVCVPLSVGVAFETGAAEASSAGAEALKPLLTSADKPA
jgi:hypothetical protein